MRLCTVPGCARPHKGHGYCSMHMKRWQRTGDPLVVGPSGLRAHPERNYRSDPATRIDKYLIRRDADQCWAWTGHRTHDGYPTLGDYRTGRVVNVYVHRLHHEMYIGPIPDGYEVDHLCDNTECTNPAHLEAVTSEENKRRMCLARDAASGRFLARTG